MGSSGDTIFISVCLWGKLGHSAFSPPSGDSRGGAGRPPGPNAPPSAVPGPRTEDRAVRAMPPGYSLDITRYNRKSPTFYIAANASRRSWGGGPLCRHERDPCFTPRSRLPVPGSRRNDDGLWRQARTAAGQADSSALAVDSPGPLGRGGPRHPPHLSRVSALADAWGRALGLYEPDGSRGDLEEREDGGGGAWGRHLGLQGRGYTPLTRSQGP